MSVLVYAEHDNANLKAATLNVVAAAQKIGGEITILVAGSGCGAVAQQAAKVAGVAKVLVADNAVTEVAVGGKIKGPRRYCREDRADHNCN